MGNLFTTQKLRKELTDCKTKKANYINYLKLLKIEIPPDIKGGKRTKRNVFKRKTKRNVFKFS